MAICTEFRQFGKTSNKFKSENCHKGPNKSESETGICYLSHPVKKEKYVKQTPTEKSKLYERDSLTGVLIVIASFISEAVCEDIQCPRNKICLLNIQNIPICRCPSAYYCRRQHLKGFRKEGDSHLCGRDGKTYRNRCLLQVAECALNKKIRVAHRGKCLTDTPNRKKKGQRKFNSKSVGVANSNGYDNSDNSPMTQVISQYPNNPSQYPSNRDKYHPSNRDKYSPSNRDRDVTSSDKGKQQGVGRRQKHHKIKENRRQRRKDRINRRTKRRYRIYWL